jgi:CubicO group peptidase (beta-lactamase class C family)
MVLDSEMMAPSPVSQEKLTALLAERIAANDFPSAVYLVSQKGEEFFADAIGNAVVDPYRIAATLDTIYDLASLTKPFVTALLCARRIESGELTLDAAIANYLPEFDRTDKQIITLRHLLTHSSGLPAWRPLYILAQGDPERVPGEIANEPLEYQPGTRVVYSDLGYISLGLMLERITKRSLAQMASEEIFQPLELKHTYFNPENALQTGIAACEVGNAYEKQTCLEAGLEGEYEFRQGLIWGVVHDGNAYFLGGSAGHAGLFSTVRETNIIAGQFLAARSKLLQPSTCELFKTNLTEGLDEARSVGWQLAITNQSTAGTDLPPLSFGHTGFTGTSCWIDPVNERIFILLTNRTHARVLPFQNINAVRRSFHSLAVKALDQQGW